VTRTRLIVCGVDEAGRGPLAGPVHAAAVILDTRRPIRGLDDSKKLPEPTRLELAGRIRARALAQSRRPRSPRSTLNIRGRACWR
jgi:ribonuclease HII